MHHRITRTPAVAELDFAVIRREVGVPGPFPDDVLAAADDAARSPRLPETDRTDRTDLELVTVDPPGARDLDQAVAVEDRGGRGWLVHYAIADVAAFVRPGDPVDREARRRTQTYYSPDRSDPLHPPVLSAGAASLLAGEQRPAVLWTLAVDGSGALVDAEVRRATVRSRRQLTYGEAQAAIDRDDAPPALAHLPAVGRVLLADAARRDAIDLGLPEQEVVPTHHGGWTLTLRAGLPVEDWNAQISLLTGRAAAAMMLEAGVGLLRTVPAAEPERVERLRAAGHGLGIAWADHERVGAVLARLDRSDPRHGAFADLATELLRGSGYTPLAGAPADADLGHAGVGAAYTHVTAPLRRLVDRFTSETCLALAAGRAIPDWATEAFEALPEQMREGDSRARSLERQVVDATEAFVLHRRVGETFPAAVVEAGDRSGTVVIDDPAVVARCDGEHLPVGEVIRARCTEADVARRTVRFERTG